MKKLTLITLLFLVFSLAYSWDIVRQAQFPTNFYALDRVGTNLWAAGYVGGFAKSNDNGQTWDFVPNPAYDAVTPSYKDINDIDFYDELHGIMVSEDGLIGITSNGGLDWTTSAQTQTLFGTENVNACVYFPDGKIWIAGTGGKILYSADHGANWVAQTSGVTDIIYSLSMNAAGIGFCALNNGSPDQAKILTTTNYGSTWTVQNLTITGNPHIHKVRQYGLTVVLAGSSGYIGVSYDNGASWTHHAGAGGSAAMQDIVLDGNTGYAAGWNGILLKTTTAFSAFENVTNNFGLYFEGLSIMPNGNIITAGWYGSIAVSADQGVTWIDKIANSLDIYNAKVVDSNTWYMVGDKGYIVKTTNGGQSFDRINIPNNFDIYYSCYFKNANEGWVSGKTTGKIFHTVNGGANWTTYTVSGVTSAQIYYEIFFVSDLIGYAVGSNNIHAKTIDGGNTWTMLNGTGLGTSVLFNTYFKNENVGLAGSSAGQLYITQNGGQSWTPISVGSSTAQIRDIWFKDTDIGVLVNSVGEIYYTTTGGLSATDWTAGTESCLDDMNGVWCDANGIFWAAGYSSDNVSTNIGNSWSIVKSTNNGANWTQESFAALTFNSTRFMGVTGTTGKLVAFGKNNVVVAQDNGGVEPPVFATNLFISEYVEGTSYQKGVEIFNGTGAPVDLSAYSLKKQTNGVGDFASELILSGILAHDDVYVIVNNSTGGTNLVGQPFVDLATNSQAVNFNGNDAVALYHNGVQIDLVGIVNQVENWGIDQTLVRNSNIGSPSTVYNIADWTLYPVNTFTYLGSHVFTPTGGQTAVAPTFNPAAGLYTSPVSVTLSTTTPNAAIYYTTDGSTPTILSNLYTAPVQVSATTTIKAFTVADGFNDSSVAMAVYTFPIPVSNVAALRAQSADNSTVYQLNGEVILSFKQTYRNQKWVQDSTGGFMIDDITGIITTNFSLGDGITGLIGKLYEYGGMLEFIPSINPLAASSTGNVIIPQEVTLTQLTNDFEMYESELVKVLNCSFAVPTGDFANGTVYQINDGTSSYNLRTSFFDVDYIGTPLPSIPMNIAGIPNSRTDGNYFTPRFTTDFSIPGSNVEAPTFNPVSGTYYNPLLVTISSATVGASIHYTTDGTTPTTNSPLYTEPISINATTTLKALAVFNAQYSVVATAIYSFPIEVANLAALRGQATGTNIYKVTGEVFLSFKQSYRNQKFVQDNTAGIMIDDFGAIITNTYNVGDGITGLTGTLSEYAGMLEFIPSVNPPSASSTGNVITPQNIGLVDFNTNFEQYESELIQFSSVVINTTETTFANGIVYPISDMVVTVNFRTNFYDVDYIGTSIPTTVVSLIGIANSRTDGNYFTCRTLQDIVQDNLEPPTLLNYTIQNNNNVLLNWAPGPIPVDPNKSRDWTNLTALKVYRNNSLIATITDFEDYEMASYTDADLPGGLYTYHVTNEYFNQYESGPSNIVEVEITDNEDPVIPAIRTALTDNYPNPFNPETTIAYSIKNVTPVSIIIYNLKGEKVRTLVNETKGNGFYKTLWNGKDDNGKSVTSGVYLYRMQAGDYRATKRMMLMK